MFCAGFVNCVIDGGAASSARLDDLIAQHAGVTSESLNDLRLIVEGHRESLVLATAQDGVEKIHGGVLLKLDAVANAVGSVHQQADAEGDVRLAAEEPDCLRSVFIEKFEIVLREIWNKFVAPIENGGQHVNDVDGNFDRGLALLCLLLIRGRRLRLLLLLRAFRDGQSEKNEGEKQSCDGLAHG